MLFIVQAGRQEEFSPASKNVWDPHPVPQQLQAATLKTLHESEGEFSAQPLGSAKGNVQSHNPLETDRPGSPPTASSLSAMSDQPLKPCFLLGEGEVPPSSHFKKGVMLRLQATRFQVVHQVKFMP